MSKVGEALRLLGGHLHAIATDMHADAYGKSRPTRFGLSLGEMVRVLVEIRPAGGPQSGWHPISDAEALAPVGAKGAAPADVWDHVTIFARDENGTPTALGGRGVVLYSGNRVGACCFFAEYCETEIARACAEGS